MKTWNVSDYLSELRRKNTLGGAMAPESGMPNVPPPSLAPAMEQIPTFAPTPMLPLSSIILPPEQQERMRAAQLEEYKAELNRRQLAANIQNQAASQQQAQAQGVREQAQGARAERQLSLQERAEKQPKTAQIDGSLVEQQPDGSWKEVYGGGKVPQLLPGGNREDGYYSWDPKTGEFFTVKKGTGRVYAQPISEGLFLGNWDTGETKVLPYPEGYGKVAPKAPEPGGGITPTMSRTVRDYVLSRYGSVLGAAQDKLLAARHEGKKDATELIARDKRTHDALAAFSTIDPITRESTVNLPLLRQYADPAAVDSMISDWQAAEARVAGGAIPSSALTPQAQARAPAEPLILDGVSFEYISGGLRIGSVDMSREQAVAYIKAHLPAGVDGKKADPVATYEKLVTDTYARSMGRVASNQPVL